MAPAVACTRAGLALALLLALLASACAPDAFVPRSASKSFDAYLNTLKRACPNLIIGRSDIARSLQYGAGDGDYAWWLDMTSRLYYGQVTAASYRSAVNAQLGPGTGNADAFDCIIDNLPTQR